MSDTVEVNVDEVFQVIDDYLAAMKKDVKILSTTGTIGAYGDFREDCGRLLSEVSRLKGEINALFEAPATAE